MQRVALRLKSLSVLQKAVLATACCLLLLTALTLRFMVFPSSDPAGPTDAVVVLAGSPETRLPVAIELARTGPRVLVVSAADGEINTPARSLCDAGLSDVTVHCFTPAQPQSTRTEAHEIARLATEHGWDRITAVTSTYHMERAETLLRRCTDAEVWVYEARPLLSGVQWARHVMVELGALATTFVNRSC